MSHLTGTKTLLALLQFLEQTEVSRDFGAHGCGGNAGGLNRSVAREEVGWTPLRYLVGSEAVVYGERDDRVSENYTGKIAGYYQAT
jgi:hypothetical protein